MKKFLSRFEGEIGLFCGIGLGYDREVKEIIIALPFCVIGIYIGKIKQPNKLGTKC